MTSNKQISKHRNTIPSKCLTPVRSQQWMCAVTRCDTPTINAMIQPHPSTTVTVKTNISTGIYFKKKINILLSISRITKSYIFVHWLTIASSLHNSALLLNENVKIQETSRVHDVGVLNTFTSHCTLFVCCWRRRKRHINWIDIRIEHYIWGT